VVFVISAGATSRGNARTALERLRRVRAQVLGVVLNKVDLKRQGYYYRDYYRRDCSKYYRGAEQTSQTIGDIRPLSLYGRRNGPR
jgi:Mrp family chromosome partitioning ATPase